MTKQNTPSFIIQPGTASSSGSLRHLLSSGEGAVDVHDDDLAFQQQLKRYESSTSPSILNNNSSSSILFTPVENSWHFLGALPYRRVQLYHRIDWSGQPAAHGVGKDDEEVEQLKQRYHSTILTSVHSSTTSSSSSAIGSLAAYPPAYLSAVDLLDVDTLAYLETATTTLLAACPHGGPIAVVTIPKLPSAVASQHFHTTFIRIMTNSGNVIALIPFPPPPATTTTTTAEGTASSVPTTHARTTAADILSIGFTTRMVLMIITRNSTCYTYNVQGEPLLQPFPILLPPSTTTTVELLLVSFFDSGVAVLSDTMASALVELLDEYDDPSYYLDQISSTTPSSVFAAAATTTTNLPSRIITNTSSSNHRRKVASTLPTTEDTTTTTTAHLALITPLPTASLCHKHLYTFCALAVLSKHLTLGRRPEVFLATSDHSVVVIDTNTKNNNNNKVLDVECRSKIHSPIVQMAFSPNGRFLACFTLNQALTVISTSFETKVLDFDTSEGSLGEPPEQIVWCGNDSVVLYWRNLGVLLVGPYGDWLRFSFDNLPTSTIMTPTGNGDDHPYTNAANVSSTSIDIYQNNVDNNNNNNRDITTNLFLVGEMDCCRVISDQGVVELIQRVPPDTASLLRIGSIEPSAMLVDAWDAFVKGSPSADEAARAIMKTSGLIEEAIETCIDAASREFDLSTQKRLLYAASYGMSFSFKELETCILGGNVTASAPTMITPIQEEEEERENHRQEQQQMLEEYKEGEGKAAEVILNTATTATNNNKNNEERPNIYAKKFVSCAKALRVLNMLRNAEIGLSLTISQYEEITPTGVIARLVAIRKPALAASISQYLDLDRKVQAFAQAANAAAFVVAACASSSSSTTATTTATNNSKNDTQIVDACVQMLENSSSKDGSFSATLRISAGVYAHVALAAFRAAGRPVVASALLKRETSPIEKVLALLAIGSFADAAKEAVVAREDELLLKSLLDYEQFCSAYDSPTASTSASAIEPPQIPLSRVKFNTMVVQKFPKEASETLKLVYVNRGDIKSLTHLLFLSQNFVDAGSYNAKLAIRKETSLDEKIAFLHVSFFCCFFFVFESLLLSSLSVDSFDFLFVWNSLRMVPNGIQGRRNVIFRKVVLTTTLNF